MTTLFLIPTTIINPISNPGILSHQLDEIKHLNHFIVETAKIGRAQLKTLQLTHKINELNIQELSKHKQDIHQLIQPLLSGHDVGLLSDCGMPAIADPGNTVIKYAHSLGIKIKPLGGVSSLMTALMASGCNGQSFAFVGYLPIDKSLRHQKINELAKLVNMHNQSQIIIEAPFRNQELLIALITTLEPNLQLSISINLMCTSEQIISMKVKNWRDIPSVNLPLLNKQEVVFIIGQ